MNCQTRNLIVLFLTFACGSGAAGQHRPSAEEQRIEGILKQQVAAWNAADIPTFMKYYWNSEELTFSSGGTTRRGWKATKESYEKRYPTPEKMGQLTFSNLETNVFHESVALVLGNWQLKRRADDDLKGNFSLVLRKIEGRWKIIHDHSSVGAP